MALPTIATRTPIDSPGKGRKESRLAAPAGEVLRPSLQLISPLARMTTLSPLRSWMPVATTSWLLSRTTVFSAAIPPAALAAAGAAAGAASNSMLSTLSWSSSTRSPGETSTVNSPFLNWVTRPLTTRPFFSLRVSAWRASAPARRSREKKTKRRIRTSPGDVSTGDGGAKRILAGEPAEVKAKTNSPQRRRERREQRKQKKQHRVPLLLHVPHLP